MIEWTSNGLQVNEKEYPVHNLKFKKWDSPPKNLPLK